MTWLFTGWWVLRVHDDWWPIMLADEGHGWSWWRAIHSISLLMAMQSIEVINWFDWHRLWHSRGVIVGPLYDPRMATQHSLSTSFKQVAHQTAMGPQFAISHAEIWAWSWYYSALPDNSWERECQLTRTTNIWVDTCQGWWLTTISHDKTFSCPICGAFRLATLDPWGELQGRQSLQLVILNSM